ncbi:MAG: RNA-binding S4 domain-containing protein [Rubrivivax sp.]
MTTASPTDFPLRGAHITLEALLKASGLMAGGGAKTLITTGEVRVNGEPERRRGRKLRAGDLVEVHGQPGGVRVRGAEDGAGQDPLHDGPA